jgi:hypothetical protein
MKLIKYFSLVLVLMFLTLNIGATNHVGSFAAPVAVDDEGYGPEDNVITGDVSDNDSDADGGVLTYTVITAPTSGTLVMQTNGTYTFTPQAEFVGFVYATYQVCDNTGLCDQGMLELALTFVNDPPVVFDDVFYGQLNSSLTGSVNANDVDLDIEPIFTSVLLAPSVGTLTLSNNGNFTYIPPANYTGTVTFMYQGCDPCGSCDQGLVTLNITQPNVGPTANDDDSFTSEDGSVSGSVAGNDSDPESMPLVYTLMMGALHGNLTFNANGSYSYAPELNWHGFEIIQYQVCDPYGACDQATLTIEVLFVNDAPILVDDSFTGNEDVTITGNVFSNDIEYDDEMLLYQVIGGVSSGSLNLFNDGYFTYIPAANFFGTVTVNVMGVDPCGVADFSTLTFIINSVNDAPQANEDENETPEDMEVSGSVAGNDSDAEPGILTYSIVDGPDNGAILFSNDGSYTYTPEPNWNGYAYIYYEVCDAQNLCSESLLMISVMIVNDVPVAIDDEYTTQEDVPVSGSVALNDTDADGDPLTYSVVSPPSGGVFVLNANGTFTFTPPLDASGVFTITYQVSDIELASDIATLTIVVTGVNDALEILNDAYTTSEDVAISGDLGDNDIDPEGDVLTYTLVSSPVNGTFNLNANGNFTYTPTANYNGSFSLTYQACDFPGSCETATVTITVNAINDAPTAGNDTFNTNEDQALTGNVSTNDSDIDSGALTYSVLTNVSSGTLSMTSNGSFTYTPASNYFGTQISTYQACDAGGLCATATITINVQSVNDLPVVGNESFTMNEDAVLSNNVSSNDSDIETSSLTYTATTLPSNGTLVLNSNGTFTYTPTANYFGVVTFGYSACDASSACANGTATITINNVNDIPVAGNDAINVLEDGVLSGSVAGNDSDIDMNTLTYTVVSGASNGVFTLTSTGSFVYTPNANYNGGDEVTYQVCDGQGGCDQATVLVAIVPTNDSPIALNDNYGALFNVTISNNVSLNDSDPDGDNLTYSVLSDVTNGDLTFNSNGTFTYIPNDLYVGDDSFTYMACDPNGICDNAVVTLNIMSNNEPPIAVNDSYSTLEEGAFTANLGDNDSDENEVGWQFSVVTQPAHGSLVINANGSFTYTPELNYWGPDGFTYQVCDVFDVCDQAQVTFNVIFVNDPPVAVDEYEHVQEDGVLQSNVFENEIEPDLEMLIYTIVSGPLHGTIEFYNDGYYTYTPDENFFGNDEIVYLACDPCGVCDVGVLYIEVDFVNDLPMVFDETFTGLADQYVTGSVFDNDIEIDPEPLTYGTMDTGIHGVFTLMSNGDFTYLPNEGWYGTETFQYMACDPCGACDIGILTITIEQPNTTPVALNSTASLCANDIIEISLLDLISDNESIDGDLIISDAQVEEGLVVINNFDHMLIFSPNLDFTGVAMITYTICDEGGLCATASIEVAVNTDAAPSVTGFDITDVSCNGSTDGSIMVNASGIGQLTYAWSNGDDSNFAQNLAPGIYSVSITDEAMCGSILNLNFQVEEPTAMIIEGLEAIQISDLPGGSTACTISGGVGPYTYAWKNGNGDVISTDPILSTTTPGIYTLTVTDNNGCTVEQTLDIVLGLSEYSTSAIKLTAWPNPAADILQITIQGFQDERARLLIFDMTGKQVYAKELGILGNERTIQLDVNEWATGVYSIEIASENVSVSSRIQVQ